MQRSKLRWIVFSLAMFALTAEGRSARAGLDATLIGSVSAPKAGVYTYSYLLTVFADSTVPVTEVDLVLGFGVTLDPNSIASSPDLLNFYNPGDPDIQFYYAGTGIGVGGAGTLDVRTFSFSTTSAPGQAGYALGGPDPTTGVLLGTSVAPVVPEPSSLLMCGTAAVAGLGLARRARRRTIA